MKDVIQKLQKELDSVRKKQADKVLEFQRREHSRRRKHNFEMSVLYDQESELIDKLQELDEK